MNLLYIHIYPFFSRFFPHIGHYGVWGHILCYIGLPGGPNGKESTCNTEDPSLISVLGRSPGEGNGNPLQYSCLENSMDRGAWRATVHGGCESQTQLSN